MWIIYQSIVESFSGPLIRAIMITNSIGELAAKQVSVSWLGIDFAVNGSDYVNNDEGLIIEKLFSFLKLSTFVRIKYENVSC